MEYSIEEAATIAYQNPSQENLAVYVKLLEAKLDDMWSAAGTCEVLEDHGLTADDPELLAEELTALRMAAP